MNVLILAILDKLRRRQLKKDEERREQERPRLEIPLPEQRCPHGYPSASICSTCNPVPCD